MRKLLMIIVLGLMWNGIANAKEMYLHCKRIKGIEWHDYYTIDPDKNLAISTAYGTPNEMEKNDKVFKIAYTKGKFFIWGESFKDKGIDFYNYYQLDLKTFKKKNKANMVNVYNNDIGVDGMIKEKTRPFKCVRVNSPPQFYN